MKPIHAKREFNFQDIMQGRFKRFYVIKPDGEVDEKTIDWKLFNLIEEITPPNK